MNNDSTRQNPRHCRGCRYPCQHVLAHGPAIARQTLTTDDWLDIFWSLEPPVAALCHVCRHGSSISLHFATLRSAHFFPGHPSRFAGLRSTPGGRDIIFSAASMNGHLVAYHTEPHRYQLCHLTQNRPPLAPYPGRPVANGLPFWDHQRETRR
ncbi:hypothetical protein DM01DRAFT_1378588 [Hesseltinella vesiculosa]|uniref:Uncharacterized protein n=1 Tax=Hesseltinella vesiculosa TaxID=101127 RepID=A0A1X2G3M8_9FUNG|nr:hypothetical protein DM01DRAFT_1378588 [Hesseltinella vesiculosa]